MTFKNNMFKRSRNYYLSVIFLTLGVFIVSSIKVLAAHFNLTLNNPQIINPSINLMTMEGIIQINNQNPEPLDTTIPGDLGDEIGVFFNQILCGTLYISQDSNDYVLYTYNYQVINNGPHSGDILNVKIWDESEQKEYDQEVVLDILEDEIKDAQGNLLWKVGQDWHVNLSVTIPVQIFSIQPTSAYNNFSTSVTVTGKGFTQGIQAKLGVYSLSNEVYYNSTTFTAVVPSGLPPGTYNLTVANPDGRSAVLSQAFEVFPSSTGAVFDLTQGMHTFGYPFQLSTTMTSFEFIETYFTPQVLESIWTYSANNSWIVTNWSDAGIPAGTEFQIQQGNGYLLYIKEDMPYLFIPGQYESSFSLDLKEGFNIVSFNIPDTSSYDAFLLLKQLGYTKVISICNNNQQSGKWESAFWFTAKKIAGNNFTIKKGKGYIIYMKGPITNWKPTF